MITWWSHLFTLLTLLTKSVTHSLNESASESVSWINSNIAPKWWKLKQLSETISLTTRIIANIITLFVESVSLNMVHLRIPVENVGWALGFHSPTQKPVNDQAPWAEWFCGLMFFNHHKHHSAIKPVLFTLINFQWYK